MSLYTLGNWTVDQLTTDTISTAKSLSLVDLSYATDYTGVKESGNNKSTEARYANTTGAGLTPVEYLRYGCTPVKDIYQSYPVPDAQKCSVVDGVRTLHEVKFLLKATNSVSGDEILLPLRGWMCLEVPTVDFVKPAAIELLLKRTVSASLATGLTDGTLATRVARGDLDPS